MNPDAFPSPGVIRQDGVHQGAYTGMTLRDYFAAKALTALLTVDGTQNANFDIRAKESYEIANAMLKARKS